MQRWLACAYVRRCPSPPFKPSSIATSFAGILNMLLVTLQALIERGRPAGAVMLAAQTLLMKRGAAFRKILARAAEGTLQAARPYRERPGAGGKPRRQAARLWPHRRLCFLGLGTRDGNPVVRYQWRYNGTPRMATAGGYLHQLVAESAEMQAVLLASPAARRIVRSMLWMLSDQKLHDCLKEAPRPKKPKPVRDEAERKRWLATRRVVGRRPAVPKPKQDPLAHLSPEERIMAGGDPGCRIWRFDDGPSTLTPLRLIPPAPLKWFPSG